MRFFGEPWGAPICDDLEQADVPVGQECGWCGEAIVFDDYGLLLPGPIEVAYHYPCYMRTIIGSVGHQRKTCSCYGGSEEDPEGMTSRQAAEAALEEYEQGA